MEKLRTCKIEGCSRTNLTHRMQSEYCGMHYQRVRKYGDAGSSKSKKDIDKTPLAKSYNGICGIDQCDEKESVRGVCQIHYTRWKNHKDFGPPGRILGIKGEGHIDSHGYKVIPVNGESVKEHRYIMEQILGRPLRRDEEVHHINGLKSDNRPENLQLWIGVSSQPRGCRVEDICSWAEDILRRYRPEVFNGKK